LPRDLDCLAAKHEPGRIEQHLMLRGADLRLDDLDGQVLLFAG
jgi:hypothetical protein